MGIKDATNKFFSEQKYIDDFQILGDIAESQVENQILPTAKAPEKEVTDETIKTNITNDITVTNAIAETKEIKKKKIDPKEAYYTITIRFDKKLEESMKENVWQERTNMTQYLNELVRADLKSKGYDV